MTILKDKVEDFDEIKKINFLSGYIYSQFNQVTSNIRDFVYMAKIYAYFDIEE